MALFELAQVIGAGTAQELLCNNLTLPGGAVEIKEIQKTVIIDNCTVVIGKVIIDGRLRKDIAFKQGTTGFPQPGSVQGCGGVVGTITGALVAQDVDIAFTAMIPVAGAEPGDTCIVLEAFVEGEKEEAAGILATGGFTNLIDKSIVFLCVKVIRDAATRVFPAGTPPTPIPTSAELLCGDRRSTGFFPGGNGTIPSARPGLLPGTWIGPTLIFPGVINPGIPSTIPLQSAPSAGASDNQIQITPAAAQPMI
ncbi:MAG TPA: hypothetical protein VK191_16910 [Symbiobacteriaceae bacterium]|nr:hypothetical protein [Symbiobacteriaceae bacterium]